MRPTQVRSDQIHRLVLKSLKTRLFQLSFRFHGGAHHSAGQPQPQYDKLERESAQPLYGERVATRKHLHKREQDPDFVAPTFESES